MKNTCETPLWAGSIQRYHNRPTAQQQTVGEHTWRVMVIYTELYGVPSKEVYYTILYHDVPEIITGDIPFLAKKYFPDLAYVVKTKEFDAEDILKIQFPDLDPREKKQIKNADLLEMLLFAVNDVNMGCMYSMDVIDNIQEALGDDQTVKDYLKRNGYQGAIDRIAAFRARQDTRPIPGARELHSKPPGYGYGPEELGGFSQHPERSNSYDIPQTGQSFDRGPKSS